MAKIFKWAGESFNVRISGKAEHNSGISYIESTSYVEIYAGADKKGNFITSTQDKFNRADSVARFTLLDPASATSLSWNENGQYPTGNLDYDVVWNSGGKASCSHENQLTMCLPADTLTTYVPTAVWSDAGKVSFSAYVTNQHYPITNVSAYKTATVNVTFSDAISATETTAYAAAVTPSISQSYFIDGEATVNVTAKTKAGNADDTTAAANEVIYSTSTIKIKNAVSTINFGATAGYSSSYTLYLIEKGGAKEVTLGVTTYNPGKAYSYEFEYVQTPSTDVVETDLSTLNTTSVMFTPVAVGVTRLQVKSTATSNREGIISNEVIIYVSPAETKIYINCGDAYVFTLQNEAHRAEVKGADQSIIRTDKNGTSLTITSISDNFDDGVVEIDIMDGDVKVQTLTVYITHITLTIETGLTPLNPDAEV